MAENHDETAPSADGGNVTPLRRLRKCAVCRRPVVAAHHPFCSRRCADVDLNRWLGGRYAIPGDPVVPQEGAEDEDL